MTGADKRGPGVTLTGLLLLSLFLSIIAVSWVMPVHRWADASTYYLQIQSIAGDQDIRYQPQDIQRALESKLDDVPAGLYLIKTGDGGYVYGKEYSYALFASPFYAGLGNHGILLFNGLMFFGMIYMGYRYLRKKNPEMVAFAVSALFFILSTAALYVFWVHVEIYNMFLITLGLFLWLAYVEKRVVRYLAAAAFIFGLAIVAKAPNAIFFLPFAFYELYYRRWKNVLVVAFWLAVPILLFYGFFCLNSGALSFYGGNRLYYSGSYPFVGGYNAYSEAGTASFSLNGQTGVLINVNNLAIVPYNIAYYLIGKFTGLLWYFPLAAFAAAAFITGLAGGKSGGSRIAVKLCIAAGIALYILEFTTVLGNNYLGGTHAIGNRYFYIYPAFLFLMDRVDWKKFAIFLLLPLITLTPMMIHPVGTSMAPDVHTFDFPYVYFPLEDSQADNLPLYTNNCVIDGLHVFSLCPASGSDIRNAAVIDRGTDLYIWSRQPAGPLGIGLISLDGNATVRLAPGDGIASVEIGKDRCALVNITSPAAEYADGYLYVYRWEVSTDSPLWVTIINESRRRPGDIVLIRNWYGEERLDGVPARWVSNNACLLAYADGRNNSSVISFNVSSFLHPRTLELFVNGERVDEKVISGWKEVASEVRLKPGYNVITIVSPEGTDNPAHTTGVNSTDDRDLSFAVQNLTVR